MRSNWQSYCISLSGEIDQRAVMQALLDRGISTRRGIMNAHLEAAYRGDGLFRKGSSLDRSETAQQRGVILPLFTQMTQEDLTTVADALKSFCGAAEQAIRH